MGVDFVGFSAGGSRSAAVTGLDRSSSSAADDGALAAAGEEADAGGWGVEPVERARAPRAHAHRAVRVTLRCIIGLE